MLLDHTLDDRKPQSRPVGLGGDEGREDTWQHLGWKAHARVLDLDQHPAVVAAASHRHGAGASHRLDGVLDEVEQDLVELIGIAMDSQVAVRADPDEVDFGLPGERPEERDRAIEDGGHRLHLVVDRLRPGEINETRHHDVESIHLGGGRQRQLPLLGGRHPTAGKQLRGGLQHRQRRAYLVRDVGGDLTEERQP